MTLSPKPPETPGFEWTGRFSDRPAGWGKGSTYVSNDLQGSEAFLHLFGVVWRHIRGGVYKMGCLAVTARVTSTPLARAALSSPAGCDVHLAHMTVSSTEGQGRPNKEHRRLVMHEVNVFFISSSESRVLLIERGKTDRHTLFLVPSHRAPPGPRET